MVAKKQSLGRNLDALLAATFETQVPLEEKQNGILELALDSLRPGRYQPRREINSADLENLANSIRAQGVLQPIVVREIGKNQYEIIAGERRFRASQLIGLTTIPAIIKNVPDEAAMAIALIENIQRENLNALEEAVALERLTKEFGLTHVQVAEAVGKSRVTVTNLLRLLTLVDDVKILLEKGEIEAGHAKVLLGLRGDKQSQVARMVVSKGLSVRETERLVARMAEEAPEKASRRQSIDPNIRRLQIALSETLGAVVEIAHSGAGKGKLVIHYNNLDELDGILAHIPNVTL